MVCGFVREEKILMGEGRCEGRVEREGKHLGLEVSV